MLSPFDSPIGKNLVQMMAETVVFEQQGGQYQGGGGGSGQSSQTCSIESGTTSNLNLKYTSPDNSYRVYQYEIYGVSQGQSNAGMNPYHVVTWDGSNAPSYAQKTQFMKFARGCSGITNPGFSISVSDSNPKNWEAIRDAYLNGRQGCTDSRSPNYNSAALKLDNSCQFYKANTVHTKNSSKSADGVRFEGKVDFYRRPIALADGSEGAEGKYVSTISEVCTDSRCESNGVRRDVSVWNETSSTFDFSQNNDALNAAKSAAISVLDAKVAELAGGYTANCGLTAQNPSEYKKATSCDGLFSASITKQLFTSNCDGSTEKIIYTASDGKTWTWNKGDTKGTQWEIDNIQDPNGRAGYGGAADYVQTLVENYENGLPSTTSITYDKVAQTSRGVVGAPNDGLFVVVVRSTPITTDGCGRQTQGALEYTYYGYQYTNITDQDSEYFNDKPSYDGLSEAGIPKVSFAGSNFEPTSKNVRDNNRAGTYEELYGKVISGCTDPNATNYDDKANTNRGCKYPLDDGNGGETPFVPVEPVVREGFNAGVLAITAVVFGGLYYFLR
jgi:hypothetical protein